MELPIVKHIEADNKTEFGGDYYHTATSQIKINNLRVRLVRIKNFWEKENRYCYVNMTLDTLMDAQKIDSIKHSYRDHQEYLMRNPYKNSLLGADESKLLELRLLLESADEQATCFPNRIQIDLKSRNIAVSQLPHYNPIHQITHSH